MIALIYEMYKQERARKAENPEPSAVRFLPHNLFEARRDSNAGFQGFLYVDTLTGEKDFSSFGKYADEYKTKWEQYEAKANEVMG